KSDFIESHNAIDAWREIWRRNNDPSGLMHGKRRLAGKGERCGYRTVRNIIMPSIIVGELRQIGSGRNRLAQSAPSQHEKSAKVIGSQLAKVNVLPQKGTMKLWTLPLFPRDSVRL